jgi:ribonuclease D
MRKSITKEEINDLPLYEFKGKIEIVDRPEALLPALAHLAGANALGFDTETRPSFAKNEFHPTCLLQLATQDYACLIRLNKIGLPKELTDLLANPGILKVGVGIRDDLVGLRKLRDFTPEGFVDFADLAKKQGIESLGLRGLAAIVLEKRLSKAAKVTNWERSPLTDPQILYAACDAAVGLEIYEILSSRG